MTEGQTLKPGEHGIEVLHDAESDHWTVRMPHQCDEFEIAYREPHEKAVATLGRFIAEAQQALAHLEARQQVIEAHEERHDDGTRLTYYDQYGVRQYHFVHTPNDPHLFEAGPDGTCRFCGGATPQTHRPFSRYQTPED